MGQDKHDGHTDLASCRNLALSSGGRVSRQDFTATGVLSARRRPLNTSPKLPCRETQMHRPSLPQRSRGQPCPPAGTLAPQLTRPMRSPSSTSSWLSTHLSCRQQPPRSASRPSPHPLLLLQLPHAEMSHCGWKGPGLRPAQGSRLLPLPTLTLGTALARTIPLLRVMGCWLCRRWSTSSGMVGKPSPSSRYKFCREGRLRGHACVHA